jgi:ribose-phosphate pyrophosphokinase
MNQESSPRAPALFSLLSGRPLLERICGELGLPPARLEERDFEDGEHTLRPLESVRGRDVYVVESLAADAARSVDDKLVRVLFLLGALRDAGARDATVGVELVGALERDAGPGKRRLFVPA